MKLFTSNYARNARHPKAISISIKGPWWYKGPLYAPLAPTWQLVLDHKAKKITDEEYTQDYLKLLEERKLIPQEIAEQLGDGAVMLCYESPTAFCHRHIVAEWMRNDGIQVEELYEKTLKEKKVEELFEFK